MKSFHCACGARVFFDNSQCLSCSRELGFVLEQGAMLGLGPDATAVTPVGAFAKCQNYATQGVCNWLVPAEGVGALCAACRLNNVIPDLSDPKKLALWAEVEKAKRRLIYTLWQLGLPLISKAEDPVRGLAFDIKADEPGSRVLTGHADGLITLNLHEADVLTREKIRASMHERYRTLLGHFRHESGHYFWDRLVADKNRFDVFRELFGDERRDYAASLKAYYATAEPSIESGVWSDEYISAYAGAHPWEDWAETFAHYLHMIDTLDTAEELGFTRRIASPTSVVDVHHVHALIEEWSELTIALNALNRSMGVPDPYPFAISATVARKVGLVHELVEDSAVRTA